MKTLEIILFFIAFIAIVVLCSIYINRIEKEIRKESKRQALESENTEFDYGHNITYKSEEL